MTCFLTTPSHYLTQCWLEIIAIHSTENTQDIRTNHNFQTNINVITHPPIKRLCHIISQKNTRYGKIFFNIMFKFKRWQFNFYNRYGKYSTFTFYDIVDGMNGITIARSKGRNAVSYEAGPWSCSLCHLGEGNLFCMRNPAKYIDKKDEMKLIAPQFTGKAVNISSWQGLVTAILHDL